MGHPRMVSGIGRAKTLTHGIFALTAQDGLDRIMLSSGLNRIVVTFVASASKNGFRETAVPILNSDKPKEFRARTLAKYAEASTAFGFLPYASRRPRSTSSY